MNVLGAPVLDHSGKVDLLGVVRDERAKFKNCTAEMSVWAAHDVWDGHSWSKRAQDLGESGMVDLLAEYAELLAI